MRAVFFEKPSENEIKIDGQEYTITEPTKVSAWNTKMTLLDLFTAISVISDETEEEFNESTLTATKEEL